MFIYCIFELFGKRYFGKTKKKLLVRLFVDIKGLPRGQLEQRGDHVHVVSGGLQSSLRG